MSSREKILKEIKANKPAEVSLSSFVFKTYEGDRTEKYLQVLQNIGGVGKVVNDLSDVETILQQKRDEGLQVVNGIEELNHFNIAGYISKTADEVQHVDTVVLKGTIAVVENAAIWMPEKNMLNRLLPFLCQQLIIVIEEKNLVGDMHEAYSKIKIDEDGYGAFIAGPSKTADIEQSLVIGAHGPIGLQVFILAHEK